MPSTTPASGSPSTETTPAPIPTATAGRDVEAGKLSGHQARCRTEEHGREDRPAAEASQREAVGDALEGAQEGKSGKRPAAGIGDEPAEGVLSGEEHLIDAFVGGLRKGDRQPGDQPAPSPAAPRTASPQQAAGSSRARRKMKNIANAPPPAASRIDQPKSAKGGRTRRVSAALIAISAVLRPVHDPIPIQTSEPIPEASSRGPRPEAAWDCRSQTPRSRSPRRLSASRRERRAPRRSPTPPRTCAHLWRGIAARSRCATKMPEAPAYRHQRSLRPEHDPEADRGEAGQDHARHLDRLGRRRVEALGGDVAPRPGRRTIATAVIRPAIASTGSDHQRGALSKPSPSGRSVNTLTSAYGRPARGSPTRPGLPRHPPTPPGQAGRGTSCFAGSRPDPVLGQRPQPRRRPICSVTIMPNPPNRPAGITASRDSG